jgi:hypothetical protein
MNENLTYVEASVVCDALHALRKRIEAGATPWAEYDGEAEDGPESMDAYLTAIETAAAKAVAAVEAS